MKWLKRFNCRHARRREDYLMIVRQGSDILDMLNPRAEVRSTRYDHIEVYALHRDLNTNIVKFTSKVLRANPIDIFVHGDEIKQQLNVVGSVQNRVMTAAMRRMYKR